MFLLVGLPPIHHHKSDRSPSLSHTHIRTHHTHLHTYERTGLAEDSSIWHPWGRTPPSLQQPEVVGRGGACVVGGGGSDRAHVTPKSEKEQGGSSGKKQARRIMPASHEEEEEGAETLELGRLRLHIGPPLTPSLRRQFAAWLIATRECSRTAEAAAQARS